jgi:hypothetical protein
LACDSAQRVWIDPAAMRHSGEMKLALCFIRNSFGDGHHQRVRAQSPQARQRDHFPSFPGGVRPSTLDSRSACANQRNA